VAVIVRNVLTFNIYLPYVGTQDRPSIVDQLFLELHDCMSAYRNNSIIIGRDFNTDLDKHNQTSLAINQFADDNALYRCDSLFGSCDKEDTYHNDPSLFAESAEIIKYKDRTEDCNIKK